MRRAALLAMLALAACSKPAQQQAGPSTSPGADLERAAVAAGVVPDPQDSDITGLYARDTDRVCIVPASVGYRIGAFVDYGENQTCSGSGTVTRVGDRLHVELGTDCSFEAKFDGDRITFPPQVPDTCQKLCGGRASFAALEPERLSDAVSEASTMRDAKGRLLCAN